MNFNGQKGESEGTKPFNQFCIRSTSGLVRGAIYALVSVSGVGATDLIDVSDELSGSLLVDMAVENEEIFGCAS